MSHTATPRRRTRLGLAGLASLATLTLASLGVASAAELAEAPDPIDIGKDTIVYESDRTGNDEIWVKRGDEKPRIVASSPARDFDPQLSADGTRIAFASDRDFNRDIYTVNVDGSDLRRITTHTADDVEPALSRDGRTLVYSSRRAGGFEIYMLRLPNPGTPARLTCDPGEARRAAVSPDGTQVAFTTLRHGGDPEIYSVGVDETNDCVENTPRRLTSHPGLDTDAEYAPDGAELAFVRAEAGGRGDIYAMPIAPPSLPGPPVRLTATDVHEQQPAYSPLGDMLIFAQDPGFDGVVGRFELVVMDRYEPTRWRNITNDPYARELSPSWGETPVDLLPPPTA